MRFYCTDCESGFNADLPRCPNGDRHGVRRILKPHMARKDGPTNAFKIFDETLCDYHDPFGGYDVPKDLKRARVDDVEPPPIEKKRKLAPSDDKPHTYTRSAKSKHHGAEFQPFYDKDPPLEWVAKKKVLKREHITPANVGGFTNYLSEFNTMTSNCRVDERDRWRGNGSLYEQLRLYSLKKCAKLVELAGEKCVYTVNDYPCVHIDLTNYMSGLVSGEPFVEYMCFVFNAYLDFESQKRGYRMPCVCRSSFGFLTPTTAPTVDSIRLNLGLAPTDFLECVVDAITAFLKDLKELKSSAKKEKPNSEFFMSTEYVDYRKAKKPPVKKPPYNAKSSLHDYLNGKVCSAKDLMSNVTRTFEGGSLATATAFEALQANENGVLAAVKAPLLDEDLWEVSGKNTLSYVPTKTKYTYGQPKPRKGEWSWSTDLEFKGMVLAIFRAAAVGVDEENGLTLDGAWAAALFAADEIYRAGVDVYHKREGSTSLTTEDASDSEDEDEGTKESEAIYHLKLVSQGGMNAIGLALDFAKLWIEKIDTTEIKILDVVPMTYDAKQLTNVKNATVTQNYGGKNKFSFVELEPMDQAMDIELNDVPIHHNILFRPPKSQVPATLPFKKIKIYCEEMYFETPHLLDIKRWLTKVTKMDEAVILLGDYNHCVTSLSAMKSFDLGKAKSWDAKRAVIVDVTSATLKGMNGLVKKFREEMPENVVLILVSSGLKHEQLGTDKNAYGTIRFFVKRSKKAMLKVCFGDLKTLPAYRPQALVSHSVRRGFKVAGMVPTISAILLPPTLG